MLKLAYKYFAGKFPVCILVSHPIPLLLNKLYVFKETEKKIDSTARQEPKVEYIDGK